MKTEDVVYFLYSLRSLSRGINLNKNSTARGSPDCTTHFVLQFKEEKCEVIYLHALKIGLEDFPPWKRIFKAANLSQ